ncbi:MAG: rhodanese-like domain-containing protein [Bacteroidota bacterium]
MINFIKSLFAAGEKVNYKELVNNGAIVLDVRTKGEFQSGHHKKAINIPLDQLAKNINKLKDKQKPIIACCASGARSATAVHILKREGYTNVHNAGRWHNV